MPSSTIVAWPNRRTAGPAQLDLAAYPAEPSGASYAGLLILGHRDSQHPADDLAAAKTLLASMVA